MNRCKLWPSLLLPLCFCAHTEEKMVKSLGSEPDVTPVCSSATLDTITLIVCKIRTNWSGGDGCRLLYQHGRDFEHQCDPRFRLTSENRSLFLLLSSLTPEDSGDYTCECSHVHGTHVLHLQVTVAAGVAETSRSPLRTLTSTAVISTAAGFLIVTGLLFGLSLRQKQSRDQAQSAPSGWSDRCEREGLYSDLQPSGVDLYQTTSSLCHQPPAHENMTPRWARKATVAHLKQEINREIYEDGNIYENVNQELLSVCNRTEL